MPETWHLVASPAGPAAWNMAVDEALLQTAAARGRPLLRVYTWDRPAVSIGYFQPYPARWAATHAIVRRPTGGGLVQHGADTTFTVIAPPGHSLHQLATADAYCAIHQAVAAAFATPVALHAAPVRSPHGAYECFAQPVPGDVVAAGRKLAGGAQRRTKWGLLHQGSIAARIAPDQLRTGFERSLRLEFQAYTVTPQEQALAEQLAREKYATEAWTKRH